MHPPEYLCLITPLGRVWPMPFKYRGETFWAPAKPALYKGHVLVSERTSTKAYLSIPKIQSGCYVYAMPGGQEVLSHILPIEMQQKYLAHSLTYKATYDANRPVETGSESE